MKLCYEERFGRSWQFTEVSYMDSFRFGALINDDQTDYRLLFKSNCAITVKKIKTKYNDYCDIILRTALNISTDWRNPKLSHTTIAEAVWPTSREDMYCQVQHRYFCWKHCLVAQTTGNSTQPH